MNNTDDEYSKNDNNNANRNSPNRKTKQNKTKNQNLGQEESKRLMPRANKRIYIHSNDVLTLVS